MRNVFDQYEQPENRLTHALAVTLHEDRPLLAAFLHRLGVESCPPPSRLHIVEQSLPGDTPESESDAAERGLPDIVIHDADRWCVLIESKVAAALTRSQLERHVSTMRRRNFEQVCVAAITKSEDPTPPGVLHMSWSEVYELLGKHGKGRAWPERLREYLRVAEVGLARSGYLTEGTLTTFDGFHFTRENPYTYGEGKRLLGLAMKELRKNERLRSLGMDPDAPGRGAITGRDGHGVWDFLTLIEKPAGGLFTSYPHLTLGVLQHGLEIAVTIPDKVCRPVRDRFRALGVERLIAINRSVLSNAEKLTRLGARVNARVLQRHYLSQRSSGVIDAEMTFRLETSLDRAVGPIKPQREWVELFASLPGGKRSNMQFQYRVEIPWDVRALQRRDSLELIVEGWYALKPVLDALRGPA